MDEKAKILSHLSQELKRGTLVFAVLLCLDEPKYGYSLIEHLKDSGIDIEQNTLYPLLRRLEKQGLLKSEWDVGESRPRKYYVITDFGKDVLVDLQEVWLDLSGVMNALID